MTCGEVYLLVQLLTGLSVEDIDRIPIEAIDAAVAEAVAAARRELKARGFSEAGGKWK